MFRYRSNFVLAHITDAGLDPDLKGVVAGKHLAWIIAEALLLVYLRK